MSEQDRLRQRIQAEAFERIAAKYLSLADDAGFYSKNWVELSEAIESELKRMKWIIRK